MRPLTDEDKAAVEAFLLEFKAGTLDAWLSDVNGRLLVGPGPGPLDRLFLVRPGLAEILAGLPAQEGPLAAGIPVGEIHKGRIRIGLEGATLLARRARAGRVIVNDKAAGLFLYGRDLLGESIRKHDGGLRIRQPVIVLNQRGEALGVGRVLAALPCRGRAVEPIVDRGWYLREGG